MTAVPTETPQPPAISFAAAATLAGLDPRPGGVIDGTGLRAAGHQTRAALVRRGERAVIATDQRQAVLLREQPRGTTVRHGERSVLAATFADLVDGELGGYAGHAGDELAAATVADRRWLALAGGAPVACPDPPIVRRAALAAQQAGISELLVVAQRGPATQSEHVAWTFDAAGWLRIERSDIEASGGGVELLVSPWPAAPGALAGFLQPLYG